MPSTIDSATATIEGHRVTWVHLGTYWMNMAHVRSVEDDGLRQPPMLTITFSGGETESVEGEGRKQVLRWLVEEVEGVPGRFLSFPEASSTSAGERV